MTEERIDVNRLIGDILENYPETIPVFKRHFGEGCLTRPGAKLETIAFGSTMHGLDVNAIVKEINECIDGVKQT